MIHRSIGFAVCLALLLTEARAFAPRQIALQQTRKGSHSQRWMSQQQPEKTTSSGFSQEVIDEANDALTSVGWAPPDSSAEGLTSDDPFVKQIDASIQREMGVGLEELLNPAKVGICGCQ